jgi:hypothetical protein
MNVHGNSAEVCTYQFLSLHGTNKSPLRSIEEIITTVGTEGRGRQSKVPNIYMEESTQNVRTHIRAIPSVVILESKT